MRQGERVSLAGEQIAVGGPWKDFDTRNEELGKFQLSSCQFEVREGVLMCCGGWFEGWKLGVLQ